MAGLKAVFRDTGITDEEFFDIISSLNVSSVHKLCALACVTLQRDGSAPNLMVREINQGSKAHKYELVMVDATRCFGTCPADLLRLAQNSDSSSFLDYWYPFCLGVPQATQPFDKEYAAELLAVKPSDVYNCISCWLASAPGAAIDRCDAEAKAVANRLKQLQSLIENDSTLSVRECCFRVVPSWRRDFNEAAKKGELGPLPELEGFLCAGGDAAAWGRRCMQKRSRHKLNLVLAAATVAAITVATLQLRRCRH
jgi:hypothetical protein